jgi:soluble lytic murein transglycosylase-like protein
MDDLLTFDKLMQAVAMRESSQNPNAVSSGGAVGLLGIMPGDAMAGMRNNVPTVFEAAEQLGFAPETQDRQTAVRLLKDPEINSMIGEAYMKELLNKYGGDAEAVLTSYNAGPNKFDRIGSAAGMDIEEQREYAKMVGEDYKNMFGSTLPSNLGVLFSKRPQARPVGLLD